MEIELEEVTSRWKSQPHALNVTIQMLGPMQRTIR